MYVWGPLAHARTPMGPICATGSVLRGPHFICQISFVPHRYTAVRVEGRPKGRDIT